jgi:hypothetical protein
MIPQTCPGYGGGENSTAVSGLTPSAAACPTANAKHIACVLMHRLAANVNGINSLFAFCVLRV